MNTQTSSVGPGACCRPNDRGFTMIELLVVITIAVILATLAAPSFTTTIARNKTRSVASELYASLSRTRSEALSHNATVSLSAKSGGWNAGWSITNPVMSDTIIDERASTAGVVVSANTTTVAYSPWGRLSNTTAPMFVVTSSVSNAATTCVSVDLSGRPYMKAASSC